MEQQEIKEKSTRGGKRHGAGRPLQSAKDGKKGSHSLTFSNEVWESITEEADSLSLSASQYIAMIHKQYIQNKNK